MSKVVKEVKRGVRGVEKGFRSGDVATIIDPMLRITRDSTRSSLKLTEDALKDVTGMREKKSAARAKEKRQLAAAEEEERLLLRDERRRREAALRGSLAPSRSLFDVLGSSQRGTLG